MVKVLVTSVTQVLKNNKPVTLLPGSIVELNLEEGDTYSDRTCIVLEEKCGETDKTIKMETDEEEFDLATANRVALFRFVKDNEIELPSELRKATVKTEDLRQGIVKALQG